MISFEEMFNEINKGLQESFLKTTMRSDVIEYKDGYLVLTDLPGISKDRVELSFEKGVLSIDVKKLEDDGAEYKMRERTIEYNTKEIYLADSVDSENVSAQMENGVLRIYLPKIAKKSTSIKID